MAGPSRTQGFSPVPRVFLAAPAPGVVPQSLLGLGSGFRVEGSMRLVLVCRKESPDLRWHCEDSACLHWCFRMPMFHFAALMQTQPVLAGHENPALSW